MNDELDVVSLYKKSDPERVNNFVSKISSSFEVATSYEKNEADLEWLELMEDTVHYIDNILRNPNRFIVNEEEVVKVEQARRITVESIKHLSKHTNFIEEIKENGDVRPSKILNINKEESYNTYENRLVYTLIQNMNSYIANKKKKLVIASSMKDQKKCTYKAISQVGAEKIDIDLSLNTHISVKEGNEDASDAGDPLERIQKLEYQIMALTGSDVYKTLAKLHVARVIPPVKKTNLILKNVNFQYAMKLWDYLNAHTGLEEKNVKLKANITENNELKKKLDDVFLLNYLTINSIGTNKDIYHDKNQEEERRELTDKMINRIVELNSDLPLEELKNIIGDKIAIVRNKKEASISEVQEQISKQMDAFLEKVESFRF